MLFIRILNEGRLTHREALRFYIHRFLAAEGNG